MNAPCAGGSVSIAPGSMALAQRSGKSVTIGSRMPARTTFFKRWEGPHEWEIFELKPLTSTLSRDTMKSLMDSLHFARKRAGLCTKCAKPKLNFFSVYCPPCRLKARANKHNSHLRLMYGIDAKEYAKMLRAQNGTCKICRRPPQTKRLAVDHDHNTGEIRGLLCFKCNSTLGWLEKYLRDYREYLSI